MGTLKSCLVTGASGLIGGRLIRVLSRNGVHVYALSRRKVPEDIMNCTHLPIDLSTDWSVEVLPPKVDAVVHLAQSQKFREFPQSALEIFRVNSESTAKLLDYSWRAGVGSFVFASSGAVYQPAKEPLTEESPLRLQGDADYYAHAKIASEMLCSNYTNFMKIQVLRFFFVYGPGQRSDMLIPRLISSIKANRPAVLNGKNGILLNPIYVDDAVKAITCSFDAKKSDVFNIAGEEILSIRDITEKIGSIYGLEPKFLINENFNENIISDTKKMESCFEFVHEFTFENGIKMLFEGENSVIQK